MRSGNDSPANSFACGVANRRQTEPVEEHRWTDKTGCNRGANESIVLLATCHVLGDHEGEPSPIEPSIKSA
ncbi:MAG: hypothetical protein ACREJ3_19970, partial [Polyangiaceae bacterium]